MEQPNETVLEICPIDDDGKRVAFGLLSGEVIFVTSASCRVFGVTSATEVVGHNLVHLLVPEDADKLHDYIHAQTRHGRIISPDSHLLRMIARVASTKMMVCIRLVSIPRTMRLARCIDAVSSLATVQRFADASSFVMNDEELVSVVIDPPTRELTDAAATSHQGVVVDDIAAITARPPVKAEIPVELKFDGSGDTLMSTSPSSPTSLLFDRPSLSNYAFEADWATES